MSGSEINERLKAVEVVSDNLKEKIKEDKASFTKLGDKLDVLITKLDTRLDAVEKTQVKHGLVLKIIIGAVSTAGLIGGLGPSLLKFF